MKNLPDDPAELKELLVKLIDENNQYETRLKDNEEKYRDKCFRYQILEEKFLTLQRKFFSRSSEKLNKEDEKQMRLFDESENHNDIIEKEIDLEIETTIVKEYTRKKTGRKKLPENLPREEVLHDLPDEEKKCPCCGEFRPQISKEETEELDIIPASIKVIKHIKLKYGPCKCSEFLNSQLPEIKSAKMPERIIPGSIVSPGLLSYVLVSKFADALPFYRQSKIFERINIELSRQTLCNWTILASLRCKEFIELMKKEIKNGPLIQMDETTVQVLNEEGKDPSSKSYMWVTVGYSESGNPLILFNYRQTRSKAVPLELLDGYKGYLQTDGYSGYNESGSNDYIIHVGCFAHVRRYFYEALKVNKKSGTAKKGISFIQSIYKIENDLRSKILSPGDFIKERKKLVLPVLENFKNWLDEKSVHLAPESKSGRAIKYTLNEWDKLIKYLDNEFLTPDNNRVENAIRPFVIGRKNWLFSNSTKGAEASSIFYSLIETAKANKIEPYRYLRFLFTYLPLAKSNEDLKALLPYNVSTEKLISA